MGTQHYEADSDGLSTNLVKPLLKQGGREFNIDKKQFSEWEISPRQLTRGAILGSGQFGGTHFSPGERSATS